MGKNLSIWSIILSVLFFIPLSSFIGLILGIISYGREKKGKNKDDQNLALVGIILGAIFVMPNIILSLLYLMYFVIIFAAIAGGI